MAWIGFIWLRVGTSSRLLYTLRWNFGFHKRRLCFWLVEQLLSYQESQCSVELGMKSEIRFYLKVIINHCGGYSFGVAGQRGPWHSHSDFDSSGRVISSSHRFYLTTHNTRKRQTSMPPAGFEPTISADKRPLGPAIVGVQVHNVQAVADIH